MINIKTFVFSPFQENTYLLYDDTKDCVIIDAGCLDKREENELTSFIENNNLKPVKILNTHGHIDHIFGNNFLKKHYNLNIYGHFADQFVIKNAESYGDAFGVKLPVPPPFDINLDENSVLTFGNSELKIFHVPGHTPGGICFYNKENKFVICGDSLFAGSIGRTDLPGGDYDLLITNIKTKLLTLPEDVVVYSGHGPSTTIGEEKRDNPFL